MGDADKADALDPRALLDEALQIVRGHQEDLGEPGGLGTASALANIATAASMLMPTPEEVIATYEETRTEVLGEVQADLITRVERAKRILGDAQRDGSRRHPALHAALAALDGDLDG